MSTLTTIPRPSCLPVHQHLPVADSPRRRRRNEPALGSAHEVRLIQQAVTALDPHITPVRIVPAFTTPDTPGDVVVPIALAPPRLCPDEAAMRLSRAAAGCRGRLREDGVPPVMPDADLVDDLRRASGITGGDPPAPADRSRAAHLLEDVRRACAQEVDGR